MHSGLRTKTVKERNRGRRNEDGAAACLTPNRSLAPLPLLIAENLCLRQQLLVLQRRKARPRLRRGGHLGDGAQTYMGTARVRYMW